MKTPCSHLRTSLGTVEENQAKYIFFCSQFVVKDYFTLTLLKSFHAWNATGTITLQARSMQGTTCLKQL